MTSEQFDAELQRMAEQFLFAPSTEVTEAMFRCAAENVVSNFYACGGILCDRMGPIIDRDQVLLIVNRGPHSMSLSAIRKDQNI